MEHVTTYLVPILLGVAVLVVLVIGVRALYRDDPPAYHRIRRCVCGHEPLRHVQPAFDDNDLGRCLADECGEGGRECGRYLEAP